MFEALPKFGSDKDLFRNPLILPLAHSLIFPNDGDDIIDDISLVDLLLGTFGGAEKLSCSLLDEICDTDCGGEPIMEDIDLSILFKNLPTNFVGSKFGPYPPYEEETNRSDIYNIICIHVFSAEAG